MMLAINIIDGQGLGNEALRELLLKKNKVMLYIFAVYFTVKACTTEPVGVFLFKSICNVSCEAYKRRLAYIVTARNSKLYTSLKYYITEK